MGKKIHILGAGLSGMVAAIDLAREGYEVLVLDRGKEIGGSGMFHPSVHGTPIERDRVWNYLGMDLSPCFVTPTDFRVYFGKKGYRVPAGDLYAVERGNRPSSMDHFLYRLALEAGVTFEFSRDVKHHRELPPGSIIATGLVPEMYDSLGVPYEVVHGYAARFETDKPTELMTYFDNRFGDYYYHGIVNGLFFGLLFQRKPVTPKDLQVCRETLEEKENLHINDWMLMSCVVPVASYRNPRLFSHDKILSGTISGMMDPSLLFGIVGATLSGKISALAVYDPDRAVRDFRYYTRNWRPAYLSRKMFELLPFIRTKFLESILVLGSDRLKRFFLQTGKLAIPGVENYPILHVIDRL